MVGGALVLLLGLITFGLVCLARLDERTIEFHLDVSWEIARWFAVGAFFCAVLHASVPRAVFSMCAGGAASAFAYHGACRLAGFFRED